MTWIAPKLRTTKVVLLGSHILRYQNVVGEEIDGKHSLFTTLTAPRFPTTVHQHAQQKPRMRYFQGQSF